MFHFTLNLLQGQGVSFLCLCLWTFPQIIFYFFLLTPSLRPLSPGLNVISTRRTTQRSTAPREPMPMASAKRQVIIHFYWRKIDSMFLQKCGMDMKEEEKQSLYHKSLPFLCVREPTYAYGFSQKVSILFKINIDSIFL